MSGIGAGVAQMSRGWVCAAVSFRVSARNAKGASSLQMMPRGVVLVGRDGGESGIGAGAAHISRVAAVSIGAEAAHRSRVAVVPWCSS